jgi:hypothetical protein
MITIRNHHAWLYVAEGEVKLGDLLLKAWDAAALTAESPAVQVLLFDLN